MYGYCVIECTNLNNHVQLLLDSYHRLTGRVLLAASNEHADLLDDLNNSPFALVSHGTESDPVFNYGNQTALDLFAMSWDEFVALPSRYSAEQLSREERARLLNEVQEKGFIDDYSGVRITKDGRRFLIKKATVWNVIDELGVCHGQAATFDEWQFLES